MNFDIPIHIKQTHPHSDKTPVYEVRPLFMEGEVARNEHLERAVTQLARDLRKRLYGLVRNGNHGELMRWSFSPEVEDHRYDLQIAMKRKTIQCRLLIVAFKSLGRRLAFTPTIPDLWFEVRKGETLRDRATEVVAHYFTEQEKKDQEEFKPEAYSLKGKAWAATLEIEITIKGFIEEPKEDKYISIGPSRTFFGAGELDEVGECLDWLYPYDLDRAILRDEQVEELTRLLNAPDKRPVMLVGNRGAGKTAIIHEYVYRTVAKKRKRFAVKRNVWHLSPQRIISGMSFVGEWEERLLAITREARKRNHVLYFDYLLGLYLAGVCSSSDLSVAHVLKPIVEACEFRILAEITPESLRVLQEKDRGFTDLFHIIPVKETDERDTLRILITAMRHSERQYRTVFEVDVIPAVMDLQRRYVHDRAFPGKAVDFLRQLAVKNPGAGISRDDVLKAFQSVSGLSVTFIDRKQKYRREDVLNGIRKEIIGQGEAVEAVTDVICKARARLNDPDRPLGTFLFLGPTGVGKTQCARAVASYLFGDSERMVRFDMNEYIDPWSVPKLTGTSQEPEGLLTGEVRRRPFCVVLLDEIEKAHPDVFDLLLQVLGEGRLTDALGRTSDFTNAIIIMTSNLGTREARSRLGFREAGTTDETAYIDAARKFFRPEFFNRLDRIVPFGPLSRSEIEEIAKRLIRGVFQRHGLRQRECAMEVSPTAMDRIVQEGYHPQLGARALKRVIERQLTQPVASRLASFKTSTPTVVSVYTAPHGIAVSTQGLVEVERADEAPIDLSDPTISLERAKTALQRFENEILAIEPKEPMSSGKISPEHERYLAISEQLRYVRNNYNLLVDVVVNPQFSKGIMPISTWKPRRGRWTLFDMACWQRNPGLADVIAEKDIQSFFSEMKEEGLARDTHLKDRLISLYHGFSLLENMLGDRLDGYDDRVLLCLRLTALRSISMYDALIKMYGSLYDRLWGFSMSPVDQKITEVGKSGEGEGLSGLVLEGPGVARLAGLETGTHLFRDNEGQFGVVKMVSVPLSSQEDPVDRFLDMRRDRRQWLEGLEVGKGAVEDDPFGFDSVIRLYEPWGVTVDFRTGLAAKGMPTEREFRRFLLSQLPLPDELKE